MYLGYGIDRELEIECDCRHHHGTTADDTIEDGCGAVWTAVLPTNDHGDVRIEVSCPQCLHRFDYSWDAGDNYDPCSPDRLEDLYD